MSKPPVTSADTGGDPRDATAPGSAAAVELRAPPRRNTIRHVSGDASLTKHTTCRHSTNYATATHSHTNTDYTTHTVNTHTRCTRTHAPLFFEEHQRYITPKTARHISLSPANRASSLIENGLTKSFRDGSSALATPRLSLSLRAIPVRHLGFHVGHYIGLIGRVRLHCWL